MSGITGIFERSGRPPQAPALDRMVAALAHRTAGTPGTHRAAGIGLAGLAADALATDAGLALVAEARLDNRADLLRTLAASAADVSDARLLLLAYQRWGERCVEQLLGDFAFALWDPAEQRLFCARDHFGTRSLYYHLTAERLSFASEIKAILSDPDVPRDLDQDKIADYLGQAFVEQDRTFYRAIQRLPPGHCLTVTPAGRSLRRYWRLEPVPVALPDDRAYADGFRERLTEALRCRLQGAGRFSILLSGGLDSSSLVALARRHREAWGLGTIPVLSAVFPDFPAIDESGFIAAVVAGGGVDPESVSASETSPLQDAEAMFASVDEPFYSPNLYLYWALARRAKELGVQVILDGVDGDTTVGHGMEFLAELLLRGRGLRLLRECRQLAGRFGRPTARFLWHFGLSPATRPLAHRLARLVGRGLPRLPATVAPPFARAARWGERLRDLLGEELRPAVDLRTCHLRALRSALLPHALEVHDKVSAAFGLDHRHPYFDRRLVEFCLGLPGEQRLSGGLDRVVQRRAMAGIVPESIRLRVLKSHWGGQFKYGFLHRDRERIEALLADPGALDAFVDRQQLAAAYGRCRTGPVAEVDGMNLWLAVTLGLWLAQKTG